MPSDNNLAERNLRDLATGPNIIGCTRSDQGAETKMALASSSALGVPEV